MPRLDTLIDEIKAEIGPNQFLFALRWMGNDLWFANIFRSFDGLSFPSETDGATNALNSSLRLFRNWKEGKK